MYNENLSIEQRGHEKKRKVFWIGALLVIIVLVVIIVAILLSALLRSTRVANTKESYYAFVEYLNDNSDVEYYYEPETLGNRRFGFEAGVYLSDEELSEYYGELNSRYERFIEDALHCGDGQIEEAAKKIDELAPSAMALSKVNFYSSKITQFVVDRSNQQPVEYYIKGLKSNLPDSEAVKDLLFHLDVEANQNSIYNAYGCYDDDYILDMDCVGEIPDDGMIELGVLMSDNYSAVVTTAGELAEQLSALLESFEKLL